MRKGGKKLRLNRETLRVLQGEEARGARGGTYTYTHDPETVQMANTTAKCFRASDCECASASQFEC